MAMGTRKSREKQEDLWVAHTELAVAPGHPFYQRLNELLDSEGFDAFVEARCAKFYAERYGRPSLTPGIYFRSLLIGYFEGIGLSAALLGDWLIRWHYAVLLGLRWTSTRRTTRRFPAHVACSIWRRIAKSSTGCCACSPIAGC
jgi:transposase